MLNNTSRHWLLTETLTHTHNYDVSWCEQELSSWILTPSLPAASIWILIHLRTYKKVKFSRYRPGVAQRVNRGIALLFHDRATRRGWVVCSTPRPHFTPRKDPVPILQETAILLCTNWKHQAFRVACTERAHCGNAFRNGSSNSSLTTKSCTCASVAFLAAIVSWPVGSASVENPLQITALFPNLH